MEKNIKIEEIKIYLNKSEKLKKYLDGKEIIKEIYVENKLINLVVR
jgi:leucyl-tRNA synthetase